MKKKTTKKSLGLTPTPKKKGNLTKMELNELKKATEMAKPIDTELDDFYRGIQHHKKEIDRLYNLILDFAPKSLEDGNRFSEFIYIKQSDIPDHKKIDNLYDEKQWEIPVKKAIDYKAAVKQLKDQNIKVPTKLKIAHLRSVKK